ncbi:MAG: Uma2 family endonuclease [Gemmataceae bacterium]
MKLQTATRRTTAKSAGNLLVVDEQSIFIPAWVNDHPDFRQWAHSDEFPEHGTVCYFPTGVWIDMSTEQVFSHNQVKNEYNRVVGSIAKLEDIGRYFPEGILLSHPAAMLSSQPDALFALHATLDTHLLRIIEGQREGFVEFEGTPDMVLEIVSASSVKKDKELLRELYWKAGIPEYWLVDARRGELSFDILKWAAKRYVSARKADGWIKSKVFGRSFRLRQVADRRGLPDFVLDVRT